MPLGAGTTFKLIHLNKILYPRRMWIVDNVIYKLNVYDMFWKGNLAYDGMTKAENRSLIENLLFMLWLVVHIDFVRVKDVR